MKDSSGSWWHRNGRWHFRRWSWYRSLLGGLRRFAHRLYEADQPRWAASVLSFIDHLGGRDSWLLDFRGLVATSLGQPTRAASFYREALKLDPHNVRARRRLADHFVKTRQKNDAIREANELRLAGGATPRFAFELGWYLLFSEEDPTQALPWFELASVAGDHSARLGMAHCLLRLGHPEEALALYEEIVNGEPEPMVALRSKLGIAKARFDLGDANAALTAAREAFVAHEDNCEAEELANARQVVDWLESEVSQ